MKSMIKELWHGNINPQEDSRNNSPEIKELMKYVIGIQFKKYFFEQIYMGLSPKNGERRLGRWMNQKMSI